MSSPTQTYPAASVTELSAGPALAATGITDIPVFMGPCGAGPFTPTLIAPGDIATLQAIYNNGPTVKEAAIAATQVASQFVVLRTPVTSVPGSFPANATAVLATGTTTTALTGTPTKGADVVIQVSTGGTTGASYAYELSTNGGSTFGAPVSVTTALTIVVLGVTLTLQTGKTLTASDTFSWLQSVASATVLPQTFVGTGTSVITVTGTPLDGYEGAFRVVNGGTIGTPGITFQYALDYSVNNPNPPTWTPVTSLGTATSFPLLDGPVATYSTGLSLNFAAGTLDASDIFTFPTTLPVFDAPGATSALAALTNPASVVPWTWVRGVSPAAESVHATIDGIITGWDVTAKPGWGVGDARDRDGDETLAAWSSRVDADYAPYTSTHWGVTKGRARVSCPINGRNNRRSAMAPILERAMGALGCTLATDWGQQDLGSLAASVTLVNSANQLVDYDSFQDQNGVLLGFIALRTWPGYSGVYPAGASLLGPVNDIQRVPLRRIMNVAKITEKSVLTAEVLRNLRFWTVDNLPKATSGSEPTFKLGDIYEPDALHIDALMTAAEQAAIMANAWASSVAWKLNRTPANLGGGAWGVNGKLNMVALGYIVTATGTAQYVTPVTTS